MTKRYKNVFDKKRRDLLKIFATAGISRGLLRASPLVGGMMMSRLADAQTGTPDKSVVIYVPNGCIPDQWFPDANLATLRPMSEPYAPVKAQCNFLRNMTHARGGHGRMGTMLNTDYRGDSFDVNMGRTIGANNPYRYVNLGVLSNGHGEMTRDAGAMVPYEDSPFNAFDRLFNTSAPSPAGLTRKLNVIDSHKDALAALQSKLGTYEKQRLDQHLTSIEETEVRLNDLASSGGIPACGIGTAPTPFELTNDTFRQQANLQADIIALALKCNLTSSCSLAIGNTQGEFSFPELTFKGNYHNSIHGGNSGDPTYPDFRETRAHMSTMSSYLIQKLQTEGLLDTTIVCELSDMGNGDSHTVNDIPLIMAGGGGAIHTGVSNTGNPDGTTTGGFDQLSMLHTAAVALGADQHPEYKGYAPSVIPGVIV